MYRIFCESVKNYFIINKEGEQNNEYRFRIALPIKGLADKELYNIWKSENDQKYHEVNNLVYEIKNNICEYHYFKTFSRDLWVYGYETIKNSMFSDEIVIEQLKLINVLLSRKYWVELR